MKRFLAFLIFGCLFTPRAGAQDAAIQAEADAARNLFGVPEQTLRIIEAPRTQPASSRQKTFPQCSDPVLIAQAQEVLRQARKGDDNQGSIYRRRRTVLALKNIDNFKEVSLKTFRPKDNYTVAQKMMTIKMNEHISEADLQLCASDNPILKNKVYLLLHEVPEGIKADILNYPLGENEDNPSFIYKGN